MDHLSHPLDHEPTSFKSHGLHIIRRNDASDLIRIQEGAQAQLLRQQHIGRSCLACAIGTAENEDVFHAYESGFRPYAGTNSFFPPFFSGSAIVTGPCVSTVGGGGASPIRFE